MLTTSRLLLFLALSAAAGAGEWTTKDDVQSLQFEFGGISGSLVGDDARELPKGYARHGVRRVVFQPTGRNPHAPTNKIGEKRRHQGLMNIYRVYSATETFGSLRDDEPEVKTFENGATLSWAASGERPARIDATWRVFPNHIDLTIEARPSRDIENFEILLANYVDLDMNKGVYLVRDDKPAPIALTSPDDPAAAKLYPFYPISADARDAQQKTGRIHSSWKWPTRVAAENAALPIAFAGDAETQLVLLGDPDSTSAVCATPSSPDPDDPPETWNSVEQHSALYLSFFCRDVKAGETHTAHARLVLLRTPNDSSAAHQALYREFLDNLDSPDAKSAKILPFPQNRLRDFYKKQAQKFLASDQQLPDVLPAFPGLDGGTFGHWGQNVEANYADDRLNEMDMGGVISQCVKHFGEQTTKAVMVAVGENREATVLFDPEKLTFTDAWLGGVTWESRRMGLNTGVKPGGKQLAIETGGWNLAENASRYLGFYRNGKRVVFHYRIAEVDVYDHAWFEDGQITRSMTVDGDLGEELKGQDNSETKALATGSESRWAGEEVVTEGKLGEGDGPYVVDTLTIPYRDANPYKTPMRVGGFDFLPDGRAAVATIMGDVWLVDGIDDDLDTLTWKRYAAGIHQALGLVVKDGRVIVLGRDQITRLHDLNGDGEADYHECVTNEYPTRPGNSYACTLHQDESGALYWFTRSNAFGFTQFVEGSKPKSIATGLRGTNGTGVSQDGSVLLSTVQEGDWTPASAIFEVGGGSFHGHKGPQDGLGKYGYELPMCFIPRGLDNSSGDIAFLPDDERFGPLASSILGTSLGACLHYKILREEINGRSQGGIVPLAGDFLSGAHRSRYNPHDGQFYVGGSHGWESYAQEDGSLQRVRYTGGDLFLPTSVDTRENGLIVRFNTKIDPSTLRVENAFCEQWNYLYSSAYGSAEYSVKKPSRIGHDAVEVKSLQLLEGGDAVFVEIPQLHPVMQLHLYLDLKTADGKPFTPDVYYSIFELGEPFAEFPGYQKVEKADFPDFPAPEDAPRDPRLVAQERLGKSTGEFESAVISCVPGLQFEPRRIKMRAGRRASLVLKNVDVEMPHNFVLVQPDKLDEIGQASMKLAADPKAVAIHYVPEDPAVIAMSPLIGPGEQYAIYFNTPKEPGEYPFLCTFPGHWLIMRGVLEVTEDEVPTSF